MSENPSGGERRIRALVADDAPRMLEMLCEFLETLGPIDVVSKARDGREVIQQVEALRPDLVVMDYQMPETSGLEALVILRRRHPRVRFIMVTVHDSPEVREACLAHGADGFVSKSRVYHELRGEVQRWLDRGAQGRGSLPSSSEGRR